MECTSAKRLLSLIGLAFAFALGQPEGQAQTVVYVDGDAPAGGDGSGWPTAHRFLQDALAFASNPAHGVAEIRVAQGVYQPDRNDSAPVGTTDPYATFQLVGGVALIGGYAGLGAPNPDARDVELYETILSGDLYGDDEPGFLNYEENSVHVVDASGVASTTSLDGLTISGGNANVAGGPGLGSHGAGLLADSGSAAIVNCTFAGNYAGVGGAIEIRNFSTLTLTGCRFVGNRAVAGAAGCFIALESVATLLDCEFINNDVEIGSGGGVYIGYDATTILINCSLIANSADGLGYGGGIVDVGDSTLINCVFSQNTSGSGGGLFSASHTTLVNCTLSGNTGSGVIVENGLGSPTLTNCILWGNTPAQIGMFSGAPVVTATLNYCDIQGGWSGSGSNNIDADPLFVQPASDDVRLSFGSPCVNAGSNAALPPDTLDLDGDGNTTEPIPFDLAGNPRVLAGIVDMGAYEGEHDPLPPMAEESDWDTGETAMLVPTGGDFNPMGAALMLASNVIGPNNASVTLMEWSGSSHPEADGYSELAVMLDLETTLDDGQHFERAFIPFDADDLAGADPLQVNLTYHDPSVGNWGLAVAGNMGDSPGFEGPIGDRIATVGSSPADWGLSDQLGDYGVFWNPSEQKGFAWGNVDHAAEFAVGVSLCPADCAQTPDGVVNVLDLITMLLSFGPVGGGGPCDLNSDGIVDMFDLIELLGVRGGYALRAPHLCWSRAIFSGRLE
ncbi:MAG: right-handed parallel beta-helix repeat-containing protein [Planctomycetota bacterium]|jgi:parallel beta-helix repeat protein